MERRHMTAMRDDLVKAIAASTQVIVAEHGDGSRIVRGLDEDTAEDIATAVLKWLREVPYEGFIAENYAAGLYSRRNIAAMIEDIEDDA
jgi:hypothetical protein